MDDQTIKRLLTLAFKCSPGDLSILEIALQNLDGQRLVTSLGSPNFYFWSACVENGFMERLEDLILPLAQGEMPSPAFAITPSGFESMEELYALIRHHYDPRDYHMSKIYNELAYPFVENFYKAVDDGNGRNEDVETLIALLLYRLISRRYPANLHDDKLMFIAGQTRQILKNGGSQ
ncbi:hypothetical protein [Asticcacaulis benevestitus]|nr:hypothetical protein [Asticcacaulis benevestitus]